MSSLTEEQRRKIEENRRLALERRAAKLQETKPKSPCFQNGSSHRPPVEQLSPRAFYKSPFKPANSSGKANSWKGPGNSSSGSKTWDVSSEVLAANVRMISKDRFAVDIGYNVKVIDFFKTITGKQYDANKKLWHFPLSSYGEFKEKSAALSKICVFGSLPPAVVDMFQSESPKSSQESNADTDLSTIDPVLLNRLFPFQMEGIRFGINKGGKIIIADDMGLGKTLQALGIAHYYKSNWPLLIICPSSMRFQWEEEIGTNLPSLPSYRTMVITSKKDLFDDASVVIISYDLMAKLKDKLKAHKFGVIILDESHSLKTYKSQRTKAAMELASTARRLVLLSGTPALSRPIELFTQIKMVSPYLFKDMQAYGIRYCEGKQDRFGWNFNGSSNLEELRLILEDKIMIRRLKSQVLDQLPSKMRYVVVLNNEKVDTKNKSMDVFAKKLNQEQLKGADRRSTLLAYFAETGRAKVRAICEHVEQILEQGKKFLIFGHHKEVLDAICETLESKETYYIRIDGSVNSEERKSVCDQFQDDDKFRVAVLSIKAANTGVTLTAAHLVVFAELFWNPGELTQAEDRAHRIGQKDTVIIQYLLAKKTADDYLWPLIQSKLSVLSQAGLSKDSQLSVESFSYPEEQKRQSVLTNYFSLMEEDDFNSDELSSVLDEIEQAVPEKKPRLDSRDLQD